MDHVLGRLFGRVAVLAVGHLAVVVDHLPEGDRGRAQRGGIEVVEVAAGDAHEPLEPVAVGQGPFAPALAAEEAEDLAREVAETALPEDVRIAVEGMGRIVALAGADGVGGVDEVAPRAEEALDLGQVLRPAGQFELLGRADHVGPAAQPAPPLHEIALGVLLDAGGIPALGVGVHVLVVVVEGGHVAEFLDAAHGVGQGLVAAALGIGREGVGMAAVVAAFGPAADHEEAFRDAQIPAQMLGDARGLVEGPAHLRRLLGGAVLVHPPRQAGPELHVGGAGQQPGVGLAADLLREGDGQALGRRQVAVGGGDRVPVPRAERGEPDAAGGAAEEDGGGQELARVGQFRAQFGEGIGVVPVQDQGRTPLHQPQHVHVAALVVGGAEGALEGHTAVGRDQQPLAAGHERIAPVGCQDAQGVAQHADVPEALARILEFEGVPGVAQREGHGRALRRGQAQTFRRRLVADEAAREGRRRARRRGALGRPADSGARVHERPAPGARLHVYGESAAGQSNGLCMHGDHSQRSDEGEETKRHGSGHGGIPRDAVVGNRTIGTQTALGNRRGRRSRAVPLWPEPAGVPPGRPE